MKAIHSDPPPSTSALPRAASAASAGLNGTERGGRLRLASLPKDLTETIAARQYRRFYTATKRLMDLALACMGLGLLLLLGPVVALVNFICSRGPTFYSQTRLGYRGRVFRMWKFRTMIPDAEPNGAQWSEPDDDRLTPVGRILRSTRLDELPQCLNVLFGEMSVVGPRPERPELAAVISESLPQFSLRTLGKPGITGWAQVNAGYVNSVDGSRKKVEYDLYYLTHASFLFDLRIVTITLPRMFRPFRHLRRNSSRQQGAH